MVKKQISPILEFPIKIYGDEWKIRLYTHKGFNRLWKNALGITEYHHPKNLRIINFRGSKVSKDTIAHELLHAYLSYYNLARKSPDRVEEKICEVIGKKHRFIYALTNKLYKRFRKSPK